MRECGAYAAAHQPSHRAGSSFTGFLAFLGSGFFGLGGATGGAPRLGRGRRSLEPSEGVSIESDVGETGEGSGSEKLLELHEAIGVGMSVCAGRAVCERAGAGSEA